MALFIIVPLLFLNLAYVTTEDADLPVLVTEGNVRVALAVGQPDLHASYMVPFVAAFLAGISGLFVSLEARRNDERLRIAGLRPSTVAATRLFMIATVAVLVALLSVAVGLIQFRPNGVLGFAAGAALVSLSYGWLGALVSVLAGRLGGAYLMLLLPMIDIGIFQNPMFISGDQALWMKLLPGFGGMRFVRDAAFSQSADDWTALVIALAWAAGLSVVTIVVLQRRPR
jgi:hypothetical protein